jgi:biotin carboxylase
MRSVPGGSPTLLVLYPYLEGFPARAIAAGTVRGGRLRLLLADESPEQLEHEAFDELLELPAPERFAETLELLRRRCDRSLPAGIFLQSEVALPVGALLARELGLPAPSVEAVHACTNKYLSRRLLAQAGVPVPAFRLVESAAEARRFAREHGFPILLKAVASSMSRLVTLVAGEGQVEEAVAGLRGKLPESADLQRLAGFVRAAGLEPGCDPLRQFLVESFAAGVPVETDGLMAAGEPCTFAVTEQIPSRDPPFFFEGYLLPAESAEVDREEARRVSEAALRAVGLEDSGFAVEMRVREGRVQVVEVNGRLGLDDGFAEMFLQHTGCHPMQAAARLAMGDRSLPELQHCGCLALAYRNCYRDARVVSLPSAEELARVNADGLLLGLAAVEGKRFHAPPHPDAYPHVAWALGRHGSSSRAAYAAARAALARLPIELTEL